MPLNFNPNKPPPQFLWATYIPNRNGPTFKAHKQKAHALNAFGYRNSGILYKWEDDEWKELYREEDMSPYGEHCRFCKKPYRYKQRLTYNIAQNENINEDGANLYLAWISRDEPFLRDWVCSTCKYARL